MRRLTLIISSLSAGGAERVLSELASHWAQRDFQVSLITYDSSPSFYPLDPTIERICLDAAPGDCHFVKRVLRLAVRWYKLRRAIKETRPHYVVSFLSAVNCLTLLACFLTPTRVIVSERTYPSPQTFPWIVKLVAKLFFPKAHAVVVQTSQVADYFSRYGRTVVIPNYVRQSSQPATVQKKATKLLCVARLSVEKNLSCLIRAFALLQYDEPLSLTIFGDGPLRKKLEEEIRHFGLEHAITLAGLNSNMRQDYGDFDIFILPSLYEGFPNALCEAMAAGLPVVASN